MSWTTASASQNFLKFENGANFAKIWLGYKLETGPDTILKDVRFYNTYLDQADMNNLKDTLYCKAFCAICSGPDTCS